MKNVIKTESVEEQVAAIFALQQLGYKWYEEFFPENRTAAKWTEWPNIAIDSGGKMRGTRDVQTISLVDLLKGGSPVFIDMNGVFKATVLRNSISIGCQSFLPGRILELAKEIQSRQRGK